MPGFYLVLIDTMMRTHVRSEVFSGCCTKLEWIDNEVLRDAWAIDGKKYGKLIFQNLG